MEYFQIPKKEKKETNLGLKWVLIVVFELFYGIKISAKINGWFFSF